MIYISHEDENLDGITEVLKVYSNDFEDEPLIGDQRGVELAAIRYIPCRQDSVKRAEEIAMHIVNGEVAKGKKFAKNYGGKFFNYFKQWSADEILEREG
jgi:hypothetical protein